ncbi:MAG: fatty acid desaturase [Chitinophagales bacterium]|nr:fatty acid desaturase [Chitinophagales bacterium]MDW8418676.1 fatty acid desaturase [Chitinophagales bacterium]
MQNDFHRSQLDQPHPQRTRELIQKYPEIKKLMGKNPYTFLIMLFVLALQTSIAYWMGQLGMSYWWLAFIVAYLIGAFANHCMYVIIHEASHNLIFTNKSWNRWTAILADLPNLFPGSMGFFVYHLKHHAHQGDYDYDADIANRWEARLIGNTPLGKALWLAFFPVFQLTRPPRLKAITMWSKWSWYNLIAAIVYDVCIVYFCGWAGLLYLAFSFFLSIGLHPVGARWIQEHYTPDGSQETFSYYGPINYVALNVGYHNEHHDFPSVPWNNLPKIRAIAPEYYNNIRYHTSWMKLLLQFLFDSRYSLFSRVERIGEGKVNLMKKQTAAVM